MKSNIYESFLKQINAQGYAKAQGYNPELLNLIEESEREEIENIIIKLYEEGDLGVIIYMPELRSVDGIELLKKDISKYSIPSALNADFAYILFRATSDKIYQDMLVLDYGVKDQTDKQQIISYLVDCNVDKELENIFENILENESDLIIRYKAAIGVLHAYGVIKDTINRNYDGDIKIMILDLASHDKERNKTAREKISKLTNINV